MRIVYNQVLETFRMDHMELYQMINRKRLLLAVELADLDTCASRSSGSFSASPLSEYPPRPSCALTMTGCEEQFDQALDAYQKALAINPDHLGANEYLGELFLQIGELEKARERLKKLNDICTAGCEELDDLNAAVLAYENS